MTLEQVLKVRAFNRYYTDSLGLLNSKLLNTSYSLAEARVLHEIFSAGRCSASDIILRLNIDKGYLSRILKKLEKDNLLIREVSEADGRVVYISLSHQGTQTYNQLNNASNLQVQKLTENLDAEKKSRLINCMNTIQQLLSSR